MSNRTDFANEKYVSLATFKRSGDKVATPVWIAADGEDLYVFSESKAGKVKRLRNASRAELAACTFSGEVLGDWVPAEAVLTEDPADIERGLKALRKKYGWQMRMADWGARLTGRYNARAYIRVRVSEAGSEA